MGKVKDRQQQVKKAEARVAASSIADPLGYAQAQQALAQLQGGFRKQQSFFVGPPSIADPAAANTITMNYTPSTTTGSTSYNVQQLLQNQT